MRAFLFTLLLLPLLGLFTLAQAQTTEEDRGYIQGLL